MAGSPEEELALASRVGQRPGAVVEHAAKQGKEAGNWSAEAWARRAQTALPWVLLCASMPPGTKLHCRPGSAAALPMLPARSNHPPCLRADGAGASRLADLAPGGGQATGTRGALHGACRQQNEQASDGLSGPARCTEPAAAEWCPLPSHQSVACEQYGRAAAATPRRPARLRASTAAAQQVGKGAEQAGAEERSTVQVVPKLTRGSRRHQTTMRESRATSKW